ncbi:YkvA family protein [Altererythrobacter arenosus]|uniref:YkvA family protein n=1 Tax=Altererythrobacter arenosus TaxID=3032592 RepID=UPI003241E0B8
MALAVAGYALSPIDLIPDVIPVLGLLDDVILLPLGIWLVLRMIPPDLMRDYRAKADSLQDRPRSLAGTIAVVGIWIIAIAALAWWFWPRSG